MESFAQHWSLDPDVVFLNHGSFGACPMPVLEHQAEIQRRLERQPMDFFVRDLEGELDAARSALADFVGCDAADLAFLPNATTGVNAVLRSLDFGPDDELLVTDHAYNACRNALDFVAARAGAKVVVAEIPFPLDGPDDVVEAVVSKVTDRTRIALLDHITSSTGLVLPIERLVSELRERGVQTLVDGAHGPGHVPLDLQALGADYYTGNGHKWLCTPKGAALLYVRRELQPQIRPVVISHGANSERKDRSRFHLEFDWPGTHDPSAYLCVPKALEFIGGLLPGGWPAVIERNHALAVEGRRLLLDALGVDAPAPESMLGNLASVPLPGEPAPTESTIPFDPLQKQLKETHGIEVPVFVWGCPARRFVRISAQLYNEPAHYQKLAQAISARSGLGGEAVD